jgi:putative tricarboxylic transport membrane protein
MLDAVIGGLMINLQPTSLIYLLIGIFIGFWVGILPGIGGSTTLALMIPFIYKMTPGEAFPFLLGMHAVCSTTGDITSILFGIPGEATTVAMIVDGFPMAKKGEAGRALGAALTSGLVGTLAGACMLAFAIPIVRPLVLAFGSPEMFMVIIFGLTCISTLSGQGRMGLVLGLLAGAVGFLCSLIGQDRQAGILRFTFGQLYLWNGLDIVPVMIGLFAIPEIVDLTVRGEAIAGDVQFGKLGKGVWIGIMDCFHHVGLAIRCAVLGSIMGMLPGLGGGVAQWVAYAHATQSAKTPEERAQFGQGDVRGVIGPGATVNAREGAHLIPTVAFGIPAGSSMAILLGAFFVLGLTPGPEMLTKYLTLTYSMVWTIVLANIIVVTFCLIIINHLAKLTTVRASLMNPIILLLCFIGAYTSTNDMDDIIVFLLFGTLGYFMVKYKWPRPPLVLGFVLGKLAETYLYISVTRYGAAWLMRPKVVVIFMLALMVAFYPTFQNMRMKKRTEVST